MELVTKRNDENPSGLISLEDLKSSLGYNVEIESIKQVMENIDSKLEELIKSIPKELTKQDLINLLLDKTIPSFKGINITNIDSIERSKIIPNGVMYYNEKLDKVRLKTKKGWINLNN